jgi:glycosyltransferase involved in cell wall biosynthesis
MWPDTLRATGMLNNAIALRIVGALCHFVYRAVDHIVVLSPGFKNLLIQRGVADEKISLIYNWADEASLLCPVSQVKDKVSDDNQFKILFAGNMGKAQALYTVLAAAELLQLKGSRVCWVMLGAGLELEKLKAETMQRQIKNVIFLPAVPMSEVGAYLKEADALLVHLRQDPLFRITIPSKTQAYMAVGKPLLMAVDGDAAELVKESSGGIVSESENPHRLAEAAQKLADSSVEELRLMGLNAKTFYDQYLSLDQGVTRFTKIFRNLTSSRS